MKKIVSLLILLFLFTSCSSKPNKDSSFVIETYPVDMSAYPGVSVNSAFLGTTVYELERCINEKGSGIFYLGYETCQYCQAVLKYPAAIAKEMKVKIYYIDAHSLVYPFLSGGGIELYKELLNDYLYTEDDGSKTVLTPHFFTVINGKITDSLISVDAVDVTNMTKKELEKIYESYEKMFEPFVDYFN